MSVRHKTELQIEYRSLTGGEEMEREEFRILAKAMKAIYAQATFLPDKDALEIWFSLLKDIPYEIANMALQKYMLTNKFPPTIAEIRELATSISAGEKELWADGWEKALTAIRSYGTYREQEALESLDELTRKTVECLGYYGLCTSENLTADRANFRMIFEKLADRKRTKEQLPKNLRNAIENVTQKKLEG